MYNCFIFIDCIVYNHVYWLYYVTHTCAYIYIYIHVYIHTCIYIINYYSHEKVVFLSFVEVCLILSYLVFNQLY